MKSYFALDVGGTQIRIALFPEQGIVPIHQERISTHCQGESAESRIIKSIQKLWPKHDEVAAIGIAAPGPLDFKAGIIIAAPNIPGWIDLPLRQIVTEHFGVPVVLGNDANLAAYGEWKYGVGQGHHNLVYLTISTGIGGGVIIDDQLLLGDRGLATELGHVTILPDGPLCSCGQKGHLESISSGTAIAHYVVQQIKAGAISALSIDPAPTSREVALAALSGDELAQKAYDRAGFFLGMAIANYLHIFNPTIVICGGGVSLSGELLFMPTRKSLEMHVIDQGYLENFKLTTAALGDDAGLMGALAMARSINHAS